MTEIREGGGDELTAEQAEAMLQVLSKHFKEPVLPMSRFCGTLWTWARCLSDRASRLRSELLPNFNDWDESDPESFKRTREGQVQHDEHDAAEHREALHGLVPTGLRMLSPETAKEILCVFVEREPTRREYALSQLISFEEEASWAQTLFTNIEKSNLLARLFFGKEKLRTKLCPEHKGTWSGIEWGPENACPHKCQLTGWIQEPEDEGKILPGVMAVKMVPSGPDGEVTVIRGVDGETLGKAQIVATSRDVPAQLRPPPKKDAPS